MKRKLFFDTNGQAMIEFLVAIVAVIAIFAGLRQVASLTKARTDTMVDARMAAGWRAVIPGSDSGPLPVSFVKLVKEGADQKRYSADDCFDRTIPEDEQRFINLIVKPAEKDAAWNIIDGVDNNQFTTLYRSDEPVAELGLVSGMAKTNVDLYLAVQHLFYNAPSIMIESKVWMVKTKDFY